MKKLLLFAFSAIALTVIAGCGPGSSVQVTTPSTSVQLSPPGPNPSMNQPDVLGRVARAGAGLWHGLIAPATLLVSFFSADTQMYEVHNSGSDYNLGFLLGVGLDFFILGFLIRLRRA